LTSGSSQTLGVVGFRIVLEEHVVSSTRKEMAAGPGLEAAGVNVVKPLIVKYCGVEQSLAGWMLAGRAHVRHVKAKRNAKSMISTRASVLRVERTLS
jgi:hypothetical protein